ncbi:hypothetical protein DMH04_55835 [Kibdelosporangium aridum]|uniref:Zinc-finger n=1 Tax=Kibdelosporangium aridum TaxID=2030 RepID=A0A428XVS8_KIBAR|nr:zf-HC2 domain-containing protein [Kibdelosporangium aridum]RSM59419.1 hypothetical protein DMH04_55835 [Kibdelosporangium aridum]
MAHACPCTVTVGAYLLEALCERESTEFREHAEVCPSCEREIAELTPTVRLLETLKTETHAVNGHAYPNEGVCVFHRPLRIRNRLSPRSRLLNIVRAAECVT